MTLTPRTFVLLPSGGKIDLTNPNPQAWEDRDLAIRLSQTFRWAGASRWNRPLSVAQHSLLVLALWSQNQDRPSRNDQLHALLHDAEEGFLGFDPITPLKAILGGPLKAICDGLKSAVQTRYGLVPLSEEQKTALKAADRRAASLEALFVAGWDAEDVVEMLGLEIPTVADDPLYSPEERRHGYEPWQPWAPDRAAARFLGRLAELKGFPDHGERTVP